MKKLLLILFCLSIGGSSFAQPIVWTNGNGTNVWTDDDNWDAGFYPAFPADEAVFDGTASSADCVINGDVEVGLLTAGVGGGDYDGTITITSGSSLKTTAQRWAAIGWTKRAALVVEAGASFTTFEHLWLAWQVDTKSYIDLYGTINVSAMFGINFAGRTQNTSDCKFIIYNGGWLNLAQLHPTDSFRGDVSIGSLSVLGGGKITLNPDLNLPGGATDPGNDRTAIFTQYYTDGKIVTPGGNAVITWDATTGITTVESDAAVLSTKDFEAFQFEVYPNPASSEINIRAKSPISSIKLHNALGQVVLEKNDTYSIDISELSAGYYFLRAEDASGNIGTKKIIKN